MLVKLAYLRTAIFFLIHSIILQVMYKYLLVNFNNLQKKTLNEKSKICK